MTRALKQAPFSNQKKEVPATVALDLKTRAPQVENSGWFLSSSTPARALPAPLPVSV